MILTFRYLCIFLGRGLYLCSFLFPQVEMDARTGPPSMAKRLKVGTASKDSGWRFAPDISLALCQLPWRLIFCF